MNCSYLLRIAGTAAILLMVGGVSASSQDDVVTGPLPLTQSVSPSAYMRGISADGNATPTTFRITGVRTTPAGTTIEAILLDSYGNYVSPAGAGTWVAAFGCRGDVLIRETTPVVEERLWSTDEAGTIIEIAIDHSLTSEGIAPHVIRGLNNLLPGMVGGDSVGVVIFDHNLNELSPPSPVHVAAARCNVDSVGAHNGLAGVNSALMNGLRTLEEHRAPNKILILVTASNDMTSLSLSSADIVRKARSTGASINVIKVGHHVHGYVYRHIASATGGRLYAIEENAIDDAASIIREIMYARKQHVEIFIPVTGKDHTCEDILFKVGLRTADTLLADTIMLPIRERSFRTTRAVVAAFKDTNEVGVQDYYSLLALLAEDLMSDSSRNLMLVGHVSTDVKGDHLARGLQRAGYIADFLKAYGVKEEQLQVRSEGSYKPRFFLQLDGSQRLLNNRVEAYYVLAEDEPYTITVGQFATESQAEEHVATWQDRGFKSYFEPIVVKREPAYQVKLWGYATRTDAEKDAKRIKEKFKVSTSIVE